MIITNKYNNIDDDDDYNNTNNFKHTITIIMIITIMK